MSNEITLDERQYKNAIDARDKLNDNYHKWMTFYYVANGAILVAVTTLLDKDKYSMGVFLLSAIGVLICILWNLSCKGYYYWSNSWIELIIKLEKKVIGNDEDKLVYGFFSKKIVDNEKYSWLPIEPANISTPKLTLIFSFVSILCWSFFSIYQLNKNFLEMPICCKIISSTGLFIIILLTYLNLPKYVKSRKNGLHILA